MAIMTTLNYWVKFRLDVKLWIIGTKKLFFNKKPVWIISLVFFITLDKIYAKY